MSAQKKKNFNIQPLLEQFKDADLRTAAFYIITGIGGGAYASDFISSAMLFSKRPCPETAAILVASDQSMLEIIQRSPESLMDEMIHDEHEFEIERFNDWMKTFEVNRRACDSIYQFLEQGLRQNQITIHFNEPGYNHRLNNRLTLFGIQKGMLQRRSKFLQDQFSNNRRLFHATLDLICIRNSDHNPLEYYSTTGEQVQLNQFDASEIQYELRAAGEEFRQLVARLREDENPDAKIQKS
ncbi:hypothetical protein [Gimesia sp.]|uniref:hypothetical protein n=1 Tax=Gimesia sp. TaxID=2024833 RepID=UPI000C57361D|nr:hypothetical protein [Gimesia sp.]MAX35294.1 hypothetical protein [Gimesia sp.]HAH47364.1 hypothetical protein [Planctomycetaceae bacterium]HBL47117.1 hypothetical protein [Planctomycetaceae bacterium]|tara:strand:- start:1308 stop:2027 length:720 start_codon:yes stop_codon:yes gene_type:complete